MSIVRGLTAADLVFGGVVALACMFIGLITFDVYVFFSVWQHEREAPPSFMRSTAISDREIDGVIKLLNQREQEYQAILGAP